jgi:probable DNA metabolism protein
MILVYDGTFESFLTLVYEVYYKKLHVSKIAKTLPESLFTDDIIIIEQEKEKSQKVLEALKTKFFKSHFEQILNCFMCDSIEFELDLLDFIILGFKDQKQLENINNHCVLSIQNYLKDLFRTNHKMTGFARFEELEDGTLYAKIEVKFNVLYFLGKHFSKRFNNQNYIIHDVKRKLAFIHTKEFVGIQVVSHFKEPNRSVDEAKFQKLWKTFFDSVAIESRENKKLQQNFVPLIYRTYMNEFY